MNSRSTGLAALAIVLVIGGCVTGRVLTEQEVQALPHCNVTEASWNHINPRHCLTNRYANKDKFIEYYCENRQRAQEFCEAVQTLPGVHIVYQRNGRVRYEAQFDAVIGRIGQKCAIMVMTTATGRVVTQYPRSQGVGAECFEQ